MSARVRFGLGVDRFVEGGYALLMNSLKKVAGIGIYVARSAVRSGGYRSQYVGSVG